MNKQRRQFWKYDLKNARHLNTLNQDDGQKIRDRLADFTEGRILYDPGDISHYFSYIPKNRMKSTMSTATWSHSTQQIGSLRDIQFEKTPRKPKNQMHNSPKLTDMRPFGVPKSCEHQNEQVKECKKKRLMYRSPYWEERHVTDCSLKSKLLIGKDTPSKEIKMVHTKCKTFLVSSCKDSDLEN